MKSLFLIFTLGVVVGLGVMWSVILLQEPSSSSSKTDAVCSSEYQEVREDGYELVSPLLECDAGFRAERYNSLSDALEKKLIALKIEDQASIYFRDLKTGMWIGFNEDTVIPSASMSKVIGVISAYEKYEQDPAFFDEEYLYAGQFEFTRNLNGPEYEQQRLQNNTRYSVRELVRRSLVYSDNESIQYLRYILDTKFPNFTEEMVKRFSMDISNGKVTLKDFSNSFRILYNATFLSRASSEEILRILTETEYNEGLVKPIPDTISVAHKFGFYDRGQNMQEPYRFNHCGIVYYPNSPYLLCISIPTDDIQKFRESIGWTEEISKVTFDWIETHKDIAPESDDSNWSFTHVDE